MLMVWPTAHDLTLWGALAVLRDPSLPLSRSDVTDGCWSMTSLGTELFLECHLLAFWWSG